MLVFFCLLSIPSLGSPGITLGWCMPPVGCSAPFPRVWDHSWPLHYLGLRILSSPHT